jgi:hypothetical protein
VANEVKIKVIADASGTKAPLESVKDGLEDVETASDKAGNGLRDVDTQLANLDRQVLASRMELKRLAHEFGNIDDEVNRIDISSAMDRVRADIARSLKVKDALKWSDIVPDEPDPPAIGKFAAGLAKMSTVAGAQVGPILGSSIGLAAAPMIASTIAGGIIGGVGLGGVAGGFAIAAKDQRVKSAVKQLGDDLEDRLQGSVRTFIPEAVEAIGTIKKAIDTVNFEQIFASSARFVDPLANGVGRLIEELGDGIESLMTNAGPAVEAIADGVGDIGQSIGEGLSSLADNGESAADSLDDVFTVITGITDATFGAINGLMEINEALGSIGAEGAAGLHVLEAAFGDASGTMGHYIAGAEEATDATTEFQQAAEALAEDLKAQTDPVFALVKAQEDLEESQENVTKATKKFGKNSPEAKQALRDLAKNALETQAAAGALGDTFNGKLTPELYATLRAAGLSKGEINRLEKQFRDAKREGDRFSGKYAAQLALQGDARAAGRIRSITDDLRDFDGVWTATMVTNYVRHGKPGTGGGLAHGGIKGAANGATSNGLTLVGENGPELAEVMPGGRVWSNPDTQRMLNKMGSGGSGQGGGAQVINLIVDGQTLAQVMIDPQRDFVRTRFGGDVQAAYGTGQ